MAGVFLSYARADRNLAAQVVEGLRRVGVEVWWDQDLPGVDWQAQLEREFSSTSALIVLWTVNSVGSQSVRDEARLGLRHENLVNLLAGVARPPFPFDRVNGVPIDGWDGREPHPGWSRLIRTLEALAVAAGSVQPGQITAVQARRESERRAQQRALSKAQIREAEADPQGRVFESVGPTASPLTHDVGATAPTAAQSAGRAVQLLTTPLSESELTAHSHRRTIDGPSAPSGAQLSGPPMAGEPVGPQIGSSARGDDPRSSPIPPKHRRRPSRLADPRRERRGAATSAFGP